MSIPEDIPDQAEFAAFAGERASAFAAARRRMSGERERAGVCWPGLLAPLPWFLYRKMYLWAAVTALTPVAVMTLFHIPALQNSIQLLLAALGGMGHRLYVRHARAVIAEIKSTAASPEDAAARIERAGGVSPAAAMIGVAIIAAGVAIALAPRLLGPQP